MIYYLLIYLVKPFYWLFRRPKVYGKENLKEVENGRAIFIANHTSMRDPVLIVFTTNRIVHFMAKAELFEKKLSAWFYKNLLVFPINRGGSDLKSLKVAMKLLEEEKVFGIFPEGKRSISNQIDTFEGGTAFLAVRANAKILPMYIPYDNFKLFKRPRIYIGKAITTDEYKGEGSKSAIMRRVTALMEKRVNELKVISEKDEK